LVNLASNRLTFPLVTFRRQNPDRINVFAGSTDAAVVVVLVVVVGAVVPLASIKLDMEPEPENVSIEVNFAVEGVVVLEFIACIIVFVELVVVLFADGDVDDCIVCAAICFGVEINPVTANTIPRTKAVAINPILVVCLMLLSKNEDSYNTLKC
jgi:hypothetical protein